MNTYSITITGTPRTGEQHYTVQARTASTAARKTVNPTAYVTPAGDLVVSSGPLGGESEQVIGYVEQTD